MPRVDYILVNNPNYFGLPSLIEISNRASTRLEDLGFIRDLLIHPRLKMRKLLKLLKYLSIAREDERKMILIELINVSKKKIDVKYNKEDYIMLALDIIIECKIKAIINKKSNKIFIGVKDVYSNFKKFIGLNFPTLHFDISTLMGSLTKFFKSSNPFMLITNLSPLFLIRFASRLKILKVSL